jgi:hypothetical protein
MTKNALKLGLSKEQQEQFKDLSLKHVVIEGTWRPRYGPIWRNRLAVQLLDEIRNAIWLLEAELERRRREILKPLETHCKGWRREHWRDVLPTPTS